jgi:hypothetical protein
MSLNAKQRRKRERAAVFARPLTIEEVRAAMKRLEARGLIEVIEGAPLDDPDPDADRTVLVRPPSRSAHA